MTFNLVTAAAVLIVLVVDIRTWRAVKRAERAAWDAANRAAAQAVRASAHRASAQAAAVRATTQARPCDCHDQTHDEVTR